MPPKLSSELWLAMLQFCDRSALLQLSMVSKDFHEFCLPLLYREVDLSIHNSEISYYPWTFTPGWNIETLDKGMWKTESPLRKAQESFLDTLIKHPEYAPFVRAFTWTLIFGPELHQHNFEVEHIPYPHEHTWEVLLSLKNVQYVDLASEHYLVHHEYVMNSPANLFPAAKSIRLSRMMDVKLVRNIVSHHPDRLEELSMNNVQHWGFYSDEDGIPVDICIESVQQQGEADSQKFPPGPIYGIFDSLTQYSNLKSLYLRKSAHPIMLDHEWYPEADIAVYKEWTFLITSVKPHLQRLTFEQAEFTYTRWHRVGHQTRRPMDRWFHDYLLPVFLESGWDHLERLEIIGVGRWRDENPVVMNDSTKDAIRDALGPHTELVVVEEASQTAEIWAPL